MRRFYTTLLVIFNTLAVFSQEANISGHVLKADSTAFPGATIIVKGTTLGAISDENGKYEIRGIKTGSGPVTLRVSFLGYETEEKSFVPGSNDNNIDFLIRESNLDLNEVVVTGTRSEKTLKNVPVLTQVINASKMLQMSVTDVNEALENSVPGLSLSQYGTKASVTLQGLSSKYVLFLVDGERIAGAVNGDIDYSMLNLQNIDRIEVIKGASSSLYGSNAIGGVINIITKNVTDPFDIKLISRYSKYNELFSGGTVGIKKGILGSRTSINYSHHDGYDLTPESPHDWTQNPYNSFTINQRFEITPGSRLSVVPSFSFYQFERGNVSSRPAHDLYTDFNGGVKAHYYFGKNLLNVSYHLDKYNTYSVLEKLNNSKDLTASDFIETVRAQTDLHLSDNNTLITGMEFNQENIFSLRITDSTKSVREGVLFAQEDMLIGNKLNIIAGIRASLHESYGMNVAPKISLLYKLNSVNLRVSAGTGFRSPELKELYMNFDHFGEWYIIGNTNLKPESSKYLSASAELLKPWNNSSVSIYSNRLSDMITDRWLTDAAQPTRQYQNIASASLYGIDLMVKQKVIDNLWVTGGYSYVHSVDNETKLQLYGTIKHSGNISSDYTIRKHNHTFNASLNCRLMGEKFYEITDAGVSRDKPYSTWKLTISDEYKWARLSAGVDNIFNRVIPENIDFISPGRRFFIGLSIDLKRI